MSDSGQDEQEDFLTRWSRRKAQSLRGEVPPEPAEPSEDAALQADEPAADLPAENAEAAAGSSAGEVRNDAEAPPELPPLESLGADSDYSAFMGKNVPADLKQQALRKLFRSPQFNIRDGLDDYDLDFSKPEPLGDIITAEMRYRVQRELERLAGLDEDGEMPEDAAALAADDSGQPDDADDPLDPEADDERSEPS